MHYISMYITYVATIQHHQRLHSAISSIQESRAVTPILR